MRKNKLFFERDAILASGKRRRKGEADREREKEKGNV